MNEIVSSVHQTILLFRTNVVKGYRGHPQQQFSVGHRWAEQEHRQKARNSGCTVKIITKSMSVLQNSIYLNQQNVQDQKRK